jgi:hypothetical protein
MTEALGILDGEYVVLPMYVSAGALIAEVRHMRRTVNAKLFTPVAYFISDEAGIIELGRVFHDDDD